MNQLRASGGPRRPALGAAGLLLVVVLGVALYARSRASYWGPASSQRTIRQLALPLVQKYRSAINSGDLGAVPGTIRDTWCPAEQSAQIKDVEGQIRGAPGAAPIETFRDAHFSKINIWGRYAHVVVDATGFKHWRITMTLHRNADRHPRFAWQLCGLHWTSPDGQG